MKLIEITPDNYPEAKTLAVKPEQDDFVAPVQKSLADAFVYKAAHFRLAEHDDKVIGYILLHPVERDGAQLMNIVRLMIDQRWQGQGFGRKLLMETLDLIRSQHPETQRIRIASVPENAPALTLYKSAGFIESGVENDEVALYLN